MVLLSITAETWIVTGLGFGIVLVLLFCLVFIIQGFGWLMQKITAPRAPKAPKEVPQTATAEEKKSPKIVSAEPTDEGTKAAIATALAQADDSDMAAIAYALYLARHSEHDLPTAMIKPQVRNTAWNVKSYGLNNVGF